jgi:hypothetical protein
VTVGVIFRHLRGVNEENSGKPAVRIFGVLTEIRTDYLPNTGQSVKPIRFNLII